MTLIEAAIIYVILFSIFGFIKIALGAASSFDLIHSLGQFVVGGFTGLIITFIIFAVFGAIYYLLERYRSRNLFPKLSKTSFDALAAELLIYSYTDAALHKRYAKYANDDKKAKTAKVCGH